MNYKELLKYLEILASMRCESNPSFWCIDDISNHEWSDIYQTFISLFADKIPARIKLRNGSELVINRENKSMTLYDNNKVITDYNEFRMLGVTINTIAQGIIDTIKELYHAND